MCFEVRTKELEAPGLGPGEPLWTERSGEQKEAEKMVRLSGLENLPNAALYAFSQLGPAAPVQMLGVLHGPLQHISEV